MNIFHHLFKRFVTVIAGSVVKPAVRDATLFGQHAIAAIAVDLQDPGQACEMSDRALGRSIRRIDIGDARRVAAIPWSVTAGRVAVFVLPRPGSSTGAVVSSAKSFVEDFSLPLRPDPAMMCGAASFNPDTIRSGHALVGNPCPASETRQTMSIYFTLQVDMIFINVFFHLLFAMHLSARPALTYVLAFELHVPKQRFCYRDLAIG